jgi:hypothetical protein
MTRFLAAAFFVLSAVACNKPADREPADAVRHSADTVVTQREMRDTGIIRHDTTIVSDTIHKRGTRSVKTDTLKKPK